MAGWLKLEDGKFMHQFNETINKKELDQHSYFVELVSRFLKSSSARDCFMPLPPMLGNGHCVDLLSLYFVVKQKGGFDVVSEHKSWGEVSLQCGLDSSFGSAFKLIYAKYLSSFESWVVKLDKDNTMERKMLLKVESDYGVYLSKIDGSCSLKLEKSGISFIDLTKGDDKDDSKKFDWKKAITGFIDSEGSKQANVKAYLGDAADATDRMGESVFSARSYIVREFAGDHFEENHGSESLKQGKSDMVTIDGVSSAVSDAADVVKSTEKTVDFKNSLIEHDAEETMNVDSGVSKEVASLKRKRECFSEMLRWMRKVATDPTDPAIVKTPKRSRRLSYGNDSSRKEALLTRKLLFLKKIRNCSADQSGCQKKQKTSPVPPKQRSKTRPEIQASASNHTSPPQQRLSTRHADVPEWTGIATEESDPKWLGTRVWPLETTKNQLVNERDCIGKGRTVACACQFHGSTECIKLHVSEKRMKMRLELRSAFYAWKFDKMGEDCSRSWTIEEEKKFKSAVRENLQTSERSLWKPLCKALPEKKWVDLVSYYYSVFMLRRRGYQNRHYPNDIDSDDDETEYRSTNNSIRHGAA